MEDEYIRQLFAGRKIEIAANQQQLFTDFIADSFNINLVSLILKNQQILMEQWALKTRIEDINLQQVIIPNATVGKSYEFKLDIQALQWQDLALLLVEGLQSCGLDYDTTNGMISGVPTVNGDAQLLLKYRLTVEPEDTPLHEKSIRLVVNADPKTLWKNIPGDTTAPFRKEDEMTIAATVGARRVIAASKRGRSHANVGGFREDDCLVKHWEHNGWSLFAVSDGAGSAQYSREGSRLACVSIAEYFDGAMTPEWSTAIDGLIQAYSDMPDEETAQQLNRFIYENLGNGGLFVQKKIEQQATSMGTSVKDFHATLIFVLMKKYEAGYAFMSFGVGDCPIGLLDKDGRELTLLNWLDVGEFGGGTRFITMPEIFKSEKFSTRFSFRLMPDFSYLMLMSDGIYDPKFEVEANLSKVVYWQQLLADLGGENEGNHQVTFGNPETAAPELLSWLDFWSIGNHDDRTLMIVY
ncbi:PP2C family serine/threonine-protein phosphatase [Chitinophaga sp. Cy-1792]|uniref:PP2C family serine/threonine-protein phosphatase n=1 Tax=Chitinophaga sp. Cy-1792 TaxID=2608339 RepID=UPI00141E5E8E|nr:PP2C family serine/threonine-protein phosphatase [Chitinophaga sp. Cy-1792]NIG56567.1 protein phosphatase 2C domain-containing protein [Chitinophaga sp. Cy-1792]